MPNITIYSFTNEPWSDKYTWRAAGSLDTGNGTFRYDCGVTIELNRIEPSFIEGLEEFRHGKLEEFHGLSKEGGVKNLREFTVMLRFDDLGAFFSDILSHSLPKAMPTLARACKGKEFFLDIPHHLGHHSSIGAATHYDQYDEAKSGTYGVAFDPALCKSVCEEICKAAKDYLASIGIDGELSICNYEKGATRDIPAIQIVEGEDIPSKAKENNAFAMR